MLELKRIIFSHFHIYLYIIAVCKSNRNESNRIGLLNTIALHSQAISIHHTHTSIHNIHTHKAQALALALALAPQAFTG